MKKLILIVAFVLCAGTGFADEAAKRKLASEIFTAMGMNEQLKGMYDQMLNMQIEQIGLYQSEESIQKINEVADKIKALFEKERVWDKLIEKYVDIYVEVFEENELKGLLDFYKGPTGKKLLEKTPELMDMGMNVAQQVVGEIQPAIDEIVEQANLNGQEQDIPEQTDQPTDAAPAEGI